MTFAFEWAFLSLSLCCSLGVAWVIQCDTRILSGPILHLLLSLLRFTYILSIWKLRMVVRIFLVQMSNIPNVGIVGGGMLYWMWVTLTSIVCWSALLSLQLCLHHQFQDIYNISLLKIVKPMVLIFSAGSIIFPVWQANLHTYPVQTPFLYPVRMLWPALTLLGVMDVTWVQLESMRYMDFFFFNKNPSCMRVCTSSPPHCIVVVKQLLLWYKLSPSFPIFYENMSDLGETLPCLEIRGSIYFVMTLCICCIIWLLKYYSLCWWSAGLAPIPS